jgi:hypothetical protein
MYKQRAAYKEEGDAFGAKQRDVQAERCKQRAAYKEEGNA